MVRPFSAFARTLGADYTPSAPSLRRALSPSRGLQRAQPGDIHKGHVRLGVYAWP